jgi:hypothetical protein
MPNGAERAANVADMGFIKGGAGAGRRLAEISYASATRAAYPWAVRRGS